MLILSPFAGVLADRWSRRRLLMIGYLLEMTLVLILAGLTITQQVEVWHVAIISIGVGITLAISEPSRQAFVHDLVGTTALNSGIALNSMMVNFASVVGPGIAGILLITVGAGWCFLINALTFLAIVALLIKINPPFAPLDIKHAPVWQQLREGLGYAVADKTIGPLLAQAIIINVIGIGMVVTLLPAFADQVLDSPTVAYTALNVALGIGGFIGSVFNVWLGRRLGRGRVVSFLALGLPWLALVYANLHWVQLNVALMVLLGIGYSLFFVTTNILIQTHVPNQMRGRVVSLWSLNRFGIGPIGALVTGVLADTLGIVPMLIVGSCVALVLIGLIQFRTERHLVTLG